MDEETPTKHKVIKLTPQEYAELERAMQWPEDLPMYDRTCAPTKLTELAFSL